MRIAFACVLLAACNVENDFSSPNQTDYFYQAENNEVDILWVVDNSCSMTEEQQTLANGFTTFILAMEDSGTDFQIGVITTDTDTAAAGELIGSPPFLTIDDDYRAKFRARAKVGIQGSDKEKGLHAAALATTSISDNNAGFIRDDASLMVIVVTDEEDCSDFGALDGADPAACYRKDDQLAPVTDFVDAMNAAKHGQDMVQISGIIGSKGCELAWPGYRYVDAARLTAGVIGDICDDDWSEMLTDLGANAAGIRRRFQLSKAVSDGTLEVFVDEEPVNESSISGWTYDPETWYLTFHNQAIPERSAEIRATYGVGPGTLPQ